LGEFATAADAAQQAIALMPDTFHGYLVAAQAAAAQAGAGLGDAPTAARAAWAAAALTYRGKP